MVKPAKVVWTYDDLRNMPEDGNRYEVIDGELLGTPSPGTRHQSAQKNLTVLLVEQVERRGRGIVFPAPTDLIINQTRCVVPDVMVVAQARTNFITEAGVECAPDLVVEIVSPSSARNDREIKRKLYASIGVREYWIADPARKVIDVLALGESDYHEHGVFGPGQVLRSTAFELAIAIDDVFA